MPISIIDDIFYAWNLHDSNRLIVYRTDYRSADLTQDDILMNGIIFTSITFTVRQIGSKK